MSCQVRERKREREKEKEGRGAGRRGRRTRARNSNLARLPDFQEEEGTGEEGFAVLAFHLGIGSMSAQELQGAQREFVRVWAYVPLLAPRADAVASGDADEVQLEKNVT